MRELARGARTAWFVTHRPRYTNEDERTAMGDALDPFGAVLAGHIHDAKTVMLFGDAKKSVDGVVAGVKAL